MFKYTKHFLQKLEQLLGDLQYTVRYEKGHFQSGYCLVESKKVIVVNRFYDVEARINLLLEILDGIEIETDLLSEKSRKTLKTLHKDVLKPSKTN